jgi:amino acid transporter
MARIMALLLALATLGVSAYFFKMTPATLISVLPASISVVLSLYFWRVAPAKRKERRRAATASALVVPCIFASAIVSLFLSPISIWPVYLCLAALALMLAIFAMQRVKQKQSHPWADYYQDLG